MDDPSALTVYNPTLINLPGRPATLLLDPQGRIRIPLDRAFCELLDRMVATIEVLAIRWELVCETCVKTLGPIQRPGDPSPDIYLKGLELPEGRVEMSATCAHAWRVYDGPYVRPSAVTRRPLKVLDDGSQIGKRTERLPKVVRDLVVSVDLALRAHSAQMRLFCVVCEEAGLRNRAAAVVGDNPPHSGAFRMTCAHTVRIYV